MKKLTEILKNPKGKLIAVDLDGVLCTGELWGVDADPEPIPEMIDYLWKLYYEGANIVIYTARQPKFYLVTHTWLVKHGVPFNGIAMQIKIGADLYIDDKAINPYSDEFMEEMTRSLEEVKDEKGQRTPGGDIPGACKACSCGDCRLHKFSDGGLDNGKCGGCD